MDYAKFSLSLYNVFATLKNYVRFFMKDEINILNEHSFKVIGDR